MAGKMALDSEFVIRLFKLIQPAVSMFLLIILLSILQYVFDMHFTCSCKPGLHVGGFLYLLLPPFILTCVVNIVEPFYRRRVFSSQRCFQCHFPSSCGFHSFFKFVSRYFSLTALWISLVLFDGDWYFCILTNLNSNQTGIPCKENPTYSEKRIMDQYKTESLDIGLGVCGCFLLLWYISEIRRACKPKYRRSAPYYSVVYENLLAEEVSNYMNDQLQEIAKQKAEKICEVYIQKIKDHEILNVDEGVDVTENISEVWEQVSKSDFFMGKEKKIETSNVQERAELSEGHYPII